jgi:dCTP deaminase
MPAAYSSTTVDLTLNPSIRVYHSDHVAGHKEAIDPSESGFNAIALVKKLTEPATIGAQGYELPKHKLILGWTAETLDLKDNCRVAARVEGKSSLARIGLSIHVTAPLIHTGFRGPIQLEIVNHGHLPIILRSGMRICQLVFELTLGMPDRAYKGQFLGQTAS